MKIVQKRKNKIIQVQAENWDEYNKLSCGFYGDGEEEVSVLRPNDSNKDQWGTGA